MLELNLGLLGLIIPVLLALTVISALIAARPGLARSALTVYGPPLAVMGVVHGLIAAAIFYGLSGTGGIWAVKSSGWLHAATSAIMAATGAAAFAGGVYAGTAFLTAAFFPAIRRRAPWLLPSSLAALGVVVAVLALVVVAFMLVS